MMMRKITDTFMSLKHIVTGTYVMHKKKHLVGDVSQLNLLIDICTSLD